MSPLALLLVITAAFAHATWNLLAKRAAHAGPAFVTAYTGFSVLFFAPLAAWTVARDGFPVTRLTLLCLLASGSLHLVYSLVLQRGYRAADLSVVYPIARGTGPLLSATAAFLVLGERATIGRVGGLLVVCFGIVILASGGRLRALIDRETRTGVGWGVATGTTIAGYTVVDGWGAKILRIHPILLDWCGNVIRLAFLLLAFSHDPRGWAARMRGYWGLAALVGLLSSLGYILVLTALHMGAPLSVVAPAREMSMMAGSVLAMLVLGERASPARLGGCALIVIGVALLSSGF